MVIMAPISVGELVDKITILMIKQERIFNEGKLKNINNELAQLMELLDSLSGKDFDNIQDLFLELKSVNNELWDIENYKRACESTGNFDLMFIEAARNVYLKNDERARIKREINTLCSSDIIEEKSY
jgi:Family of unknown function (DUF6165)